MISCKTACVGGCLNSCTDACNDGCTGGNVASLYSIARGEYITSSDVNKLRTFLNNEMTRRGLKITTPKPNNRDIALEKFSQFIEDDLKSMGKIAPAINVSDTISGPNWFDNVNKLLQELYDMMV